MAIWPENRDGFPIALIYRRTLSFSVHSSVVILSIITIRLLRNPAILNRQLSLSAHVPSIIDLSHLSLNGNVQRPVWAMLMITIVYLTVSV